VPGDRESIRLFVRERVPELSGRRPATKPE